jgi:hypothetical protein
MHDMLSEAACDFYRKAWMTGPVYGEIKMTRFADSVIVTSAPTVALIDPEVLFHVRSVVRIRDRCLIIIGGQAEYRITGFDRERGALVVLLERDLR